MDGPNVALELELARVGIAAVAEFEDARKACLKQASLLESYRLFDDDEQGISYQKLVDLILEARFEDSMHSRPAA